MDNRGADMYLIRALDNIYIGKVEAWEIAIERGIEQLPRKGRQILTVHAIASGKGIDVIGKDENGYYLNHIEEVQA